MSLALKTKSLAHSSSSASADESFISIHDSRNFLQSILIFIPLNRTASLPISLINHPIKGNTLLEGYLNILSFISVGQDKATIAFGFFIFLAARIEEKAPRLCPIRPIRELSISG